MINNKVDFSQELDRMKSLINYKTNVNESVSNTGMLTPRLEYSQKAADGRTYGIIRECNKFYIKIAPNKDTELLAEDYDYIGGYLNRKENEYNSYAAASKNFDLKMMAINETHEATKQKVSQFVEKEVSDWQVNETKEMRSEINRFNQILKNVGLIQEGKTTEPAVGKVGKVGSSAPFDKKATTSGNYDNKNEHDDPKTADDTFKDKSKPSGNNDGKNKHSDPKTADDTFDEDVKKGDIESDGESVATKKTSGGKVVKVNEGRRVIKLTEAQVLAWNKSKEYMDKSHGTEIGSSAPFGDEVGEESNQTEAPTEKIHEGEAVYKNGKIPTSVGETGDDDPFTEKVNENLHVETDDVAGAKGFDGDGLGEDYVEGDELSDIPFPEVEETDDFEDEEIIDSPEEEPFNNDDDEYGFSDETDDVEIDGDIEGDLDADIEGLGDDELGDVERVNFEDYGNDEFGDEGFNEPNDIQFETIRRTINRIVESELKDFGKHPAYRKVPMTTPANKEVAPNGARDWNDKSVESETPFGEKIGDSAPFDEKVVDMLANAIVQKMGFQKKA